MIFEQSLIASKLPVCDIAPSIASEGEMFFDTTQNMLMVYVGGGWVPAIKPQVVSTDFSIFLPSIPNHTCTIFKSVLLRDMTFDSSEIIMACDSGFVVLTFHVDGVEQVGSKFQCKKGECLSIVFTHDIRQTPSDLSLSFSGTH